MTIPPTGPPLPTGERPPSPFASRGFIAGSAFVAALVIVALILAVFQLSQDDDPAAETDPGPPSPTQDTSQTTTTDSLCGLEGNSDQGSVVDGPEDTWVDLDGTAVPQSDQYGPGETTDSGVGYCYAHTPEGAVIAAGNLFGITSNYALYEDMIDHLIVPGPGASVLKKAIQDGDLPDVAGAERPYAQGFRVNSYTSDRATVAVLAGLSTGYMLFTYDLAWSAGDWRLITNDDGSPLTDPVAASDAAGFIPWGAR